MTQLLVVAFDELEAAKQARRALHDLQKQRLVSIEDAAVISRDAGGKTHVHNEVDGDVKPCAVVREAFPARGAGAVEGSPQPAPLEHTELVEEQRRALHAAGTGYVRAVDVERLCGSPRTTTSRRAGQEPGAQDRHQSGCH